MACRWMTDPETGQRYHVPDCWGGLHDPAGCYCRRSKANRDAYDLEEDELAELRDRISALEEKLAARSLESTP